MVLIWHMMMHQHWYGTDLTYDDASTWIWYWFDIWWCINIDLVLINIWWCINMGMVLMMHQHWYGTYLTYDDASTLIWCLSTYDDASTWVWYDDASTWIWMVLGNIWRCINMGIVLINIRWCINMHMVLSQHVMWHQNGYLLTISRCINIYTDSIYHPVFVCLFVWFDSLRPLNNLSVMRDGSFWVEPVLS